jgi:hypothetical protein
VSLFGLTACISAEHVGEAKEPGGRLPHRFARHLRVGVRGVAAGILGAIAKEAGPTGDPGLTTLSAAS